MTLGNYFQSLSYCKTCPVDRDDTAPLIKESKNKPIVFFDYNAYYG